MIDKLRWIERNGEKVLQQFVATDFNYDPDPDMPGRAVAVAAGWGWQDVPLEQEINHV